MSTFLEPVYLNEKMVLNCAAYLFKGVGLESREVQSASTEAKGMLKLGSEFLQKLLLPLSAEGAVARVTSRETETARRYTIGGLHMALLDELRRSNQVVAPGKDTESKTAPYVEAVAILKPVDLFSIIETMKVLAPLIGEVLKTFGHQLAPKVFKNEVKKDLPKYQEAILTVLGHLETDYLKSKQLEMIMEDPSCHRQLGVLDLDVSDHDPSAVKARLTGGTFHVIGKITSFVESESSMSLVERSALSTLMDLLDRLVGLNTQEENIAQYRNAIGTARTLVEKVCQLRIPGPAFRMMAMSVCV